MANDLFGKGTPAVPASGGALTGTGMGGFEKLLAAKKAPAVIGAPQPASAKDPFEDMKRARDELAAHRRKPLLVYLHLDATASREETREAMRAHEEEVARKVMASGGKHPVICMGVSYKGDCCSPPVRLNTHEDIMNFFATSPEGGVTQIAEAITHYLNDPTEAILSLGIFFGDSMDSSDNLPQLMGLATQLSGKKRPLVIAHEYTGGTHSTNFCDKVAPALAQASGAFAFGLSQSPTELESLLEGYKRILSEMPDDLKKSAAKQAADMSGLSSPVRDFLARQAGALLEQLNGPK